MSNTCHVVLNSEHKNPDENSKNNITHLHNSPYSLKFQTNVNWPLKDLSYPTAVGRVERQDESQPIGDKNEIL